MKTKILLIICIGLLVLFLLTETRASRRPIISTSTTAPVRRLIERVEKLERKFVDLERIENRIDLLEQKIFPSTKQKNHILIEAKFKLPLELGQIAYLNRGNYPRVEQVVDKINMLIDITIGQEFRRSSSFPAPRESRFLTSAPGGRYYPITRLIWIKGLKTSGIVDGKKLTIAIPMTITGTKTYTTVTGGSKTIFVFEPYQK